MSGKVADEAARTSGPVSDPNSGPTLAPTPQDVARMRRSMTLGVEEEFQVLDRTSRELVPRAPELLALLPAASFTAELQRSVVETNSSVHADLDSLREDLLALRRLLGETAGVLGLGVAAVGTVPLVSDRIAVTTTARYSRMLEDYQLLVREQLICGVQVHVAIDDRDVAVAVAQRLAPALPLLLALSASSPFWMGADSGYASVRSLVWSRWPTAGPVVGVSSAEDHDRLVADLVATGTISDPGMIYFDVRPSAHLPTLELRVTDACPDVDDVILLAALFRALVCRERDLVVAGFEAPTWPTPLLRAAMWRAARSGLEGDLLHLAHSATPLPAPQAINGLVQELRPQLEAFGDWDTAAELCRLLLARGSSADQQRRAFSRRGRLTDVVDLVLARTSASRSPRPPGPLARRFPPSVAQPYVRAGDEAFGQADGPSAFYQGMLSVLDRLGQPGLRLREAARDEEQRSHGVTFGVPGEASTRLFPVDLIPRIVPADQWQHLTSGLIQRARALDAFLADVYGPRTTVAEGVVPRWLVEGAPGLGSTGALLRRQKHRAHVCGMDVVRDAEGTWQVLEDNLRVPSGIGYAVQNRRLTRAVMGDLPRPADLLDVEDVPRLLLDALREAALPSARDDPSVVLLSEGPAGPAWFEHRMLGEEMGIPVVTTDEILVEGTSVMHLHEGIRAPIDVIYLRIGEETLRHRPGADGHPLGPPLLGAVHAGTVALANAPGNGVGDDKAVYAYVDRLIEYFLGEKPLLKSVPTLLCADPEAREIVLSRLDALVLKPVDGYGGDGVLIGPMASDQELAAARRQIETAPHRWVAQETVSLSTMPCFDGTALVPRHVDLRAFVLLGDRPCVAPAALTRVAPAGSMIVNSSRGGGSKDTWLLGPNSVV